MQNPFMPIASMYQTQLEASRRFADALFAGTEKIDHVLIDASHRAFNEQVRFAQSLAGVRDPQSAANAQSAYLSQRPEVAMDYQRELITVFSEIQNEIGQSMRQYFEDVGQSALSAAQSERDAAEESEFNPMSGMFSAWESAFREATSLASKNVEAASNSFRGAANAAYSRTADTVEEVGEEIASTTRGERKSSGHGHGKRK